MQTPEFLVWAIEYSCPVRGSQDGSDPERTERQLRAARAVSDARREGRVFEWFCVEPPNGFRIEDTLVVYGGLPAVERACSECPANALAEMDSGALAGCYGIVALPDDPTTVHQAIEQGIERAYPSVDWSGICVVTTSRWYGLWMESPLWAEHLLVRFCVLEATAIENDVTREGVRRLMVGLNVAFNADCRVHVALYPRGRVEGTEWQLVTHCPRCKAEWGDDDERHCSVCGYAGSPAPDVKRKARGTRPYFPLERVLGSEAAEAFFVRYEAFRAQQRLPHQP